MTPKAWTDYAAAALARERERRCDVYLQTYSFGKDMVRLEDERCTLRAGHEGAHE